MTTGALSTLRGVGSPRIPHVCGDCGHRHYPFQTCRRAANNREHGRVLANMTAPPGFRPFGDHLGTLQQIGDGTFMRSAPIHYTRRP